MWSDYFPDYYGGFGNASAPWNESTGTGYGGGPNASDNSTIPNGGWSQSVANLMAPYNPSWPSYDPSNPSGPIYFPWPDPGGGGGSPFPPIFIEPFPTVYPGPPESGTTPTPPPAAQPEPTPTYRTEGTAPRPTDPRDVVTGAAAGGGLAAAIAGILRGSGVGRPENNPVTRTSIPEPPGEQKPPDTSTPPPTVPPQVPDTGVPTYDVTRAEPRQTGSRDTGPVNARTDIPYIPTEIKPPGIYPPVVVGMPNPPILEEPVIPPPVLPPVTDPNLPPPPITPPKIPDIPKIPGLSGVVGSGSGAPLPGPFAPLVGAGPTQSVFQDNYRPSPIPSIGELLSQFAQIYGGR